MSPPIYTPDGSEVSEIVLPDGSTASQVIGPDGNVVFEAGPDIPDSGVLRWRFEDDSAPNTAVDSWGSNSGTINGATYTTDSFEGSFALDFDGTDDYIDAPFNTSDYTGSGFTIAAWVKLADHNHQGLTGSRDSNGNFFFDIFDTQFRFGTFDGSTVYAAQTTTLPTIGTYELLVGTYDPTDGYSLYIDGSEVASSAETTFATDGNVEFVGAQNNTEFSNFNYSTATFDDYRLYDKALSPTEVSNLNNTGSINA